MPRRLFDVVVKSFVPHPAGIFQRRRRMTAGQVAHDAGRDHAALHAKANSAEMEHS
jgi:hypothetical protein